MNSSNSRRIKCEYNETIRIKPVFDVHYGHKLCDVKAFINYLKDSDENTYFIGGGDLLDSIVVQDFRYRKSMDASETENIMNEQVNDLCDILSPYKDRFLLGASGNHEKTIVRKSSYNPMLDICKRLDIPYAGISWIYTLRLRGKDGGGRTIYIRGHHGWGGGSRTQGADLTKFSKDTNYYDCDLFLYGHVHRKQFDEIPRLSIVGNKLIAKPKKLVICGTFQKTMSDNSDDSWSEEQGFPPVAIGGVDIYITPKPNSWVDIKVDI